MKYAKTALLCIAAAATAYTGIYWYYKKNKRENILATIKKSIQERNSIISGKISELQVSFNKEPTLTQQKKEMIDEILSNMAYIDQEIREKWIHEDKKLEQDLSQLSKEIDKINTMRLKKLLKLAKKEWFTITEFSEFSDSNAWLIIQHAEPEVEKEFLPIIEKYALAGESNKAHWAMLYDRVAMYENRPQKYGSQFRNSEDNSCYELYPVEDRENLDKLRATVGLKPISENAKEMEETYKRKCKI